LTAVKSYYNSAYRDTSLHRRHRKRRSARKTRLLLLLVGLMCLIIAVAVLALARFLGKPSTQAKWAVLSAVYFGAGLLLLVVRLIVDAVAKANAKRKGKLRAEAAAARDMAGGEHAGTGQIQP
jgi:hypothetical protein